MFNERFKIALQNKGMLQSEIADKIGVSRSVITQYLQGSCVPKQRLTILIAKELEVSVDWLMGLDVAPTQKLIEEIYQQIITLNGDELLKLKSLLSLMFTKEGD